MPGNNSKMLWTEYLKYDEVPKSLDPASGVAKIQAQVKQQLLAMPSPVRQAWDDTQRRRVQPNGSGEWPIPEP